MIVCLLALPPPWAVPSSGSASPCSTQSSLKYRWTRQLRFIVIENETGKEMGKYPLLSRDPAPGVCCYDLMFTTSLQGSSIPLTRMWIKTEKQLSQGHDSQIFGEARVQSQTRLMMKTLCPSPYIGMPSTAPRSTLSPCPTSHIKNF